MDIASSCFDFDVLYLIEILFLLISILKSGNALGID